MTAYFDPGEPLDDDTARWLGELAAGAHAAGNASVAANPRDPAFFMLMDGNVSTPVVRDDRCYICRDPEYAAMGLPLCSPCPQCVRERMTLCPACQQEGVLPNGERCSDCLGQGFAGTLGHIAADDEVCDECEYQHGPDDYGEDGLLTGMPREKALYVWQLKHPGQEHP